ncbi:IS66 family insertion sequence element accessory protein TnpB [Halomonas sp. TBZ9]|uniref:IS66 family insertion sequence element accessory protein TnpB n=1 Tax=Vreelandella azerica TaxID=2732867 RepID=A0A7Y3TX08_9GAMM|nr:IS66 family insertion sequence element accessory protein TnpB [Halomonas azerica]NOG31685.1 IS66 family insertion sequence element accessory protein TnpB [Halomonas azerica]
MTHQEREQYWQQQVTEWQASGLSGMAFCKQQALTYHQFSYWRQKLLASASATKEPAAGFATVAYPNTGTAKEIDSTGLAVSLPGGITITGLHAGNVALLGDILRQL